MLLRKWLRIDSEYTMEDGEDSGGPPDGEQEFQLNEALLD